MQYQRGRWPANDVPAVTKIDRTRSAAETHRKMARLLLRSLGGARFRAADAVNDALPQGARRGPRSKIIDSVRCAENHIASGQRRIERSPYCTPGPKIAGKISEGE